MPRLLRSYAARSFPTPNCTIVQAAMTTLTIPGLSEPIHIGQGGLVQRLTDSSFGHNNPIRTLIQEASAIFGPQASLAAIVSMGSGKVAVSLPETHGERTLETIVSRLAQCCEPAHEELQHRAQHLDVYFRFNVEQNMGQTVQDEWRLSWRVQSATNAYLQEGFNNQRMDAAAASICIPSAKSTIAVLSKFA